MLRKSVDKEGSMSTWIVLGALVFYFIFYFFVRT